MTKKKSSHTMPLAPVCDLIASYKRAAALAALDHVRSGMIIGLGTGSTADFFIEALGTKVAEGLEVQGVPTSERTAARARAVGIPLIAFHAWSRIDLAVDGADELNPSLMALKGGGGALLHEKIVARACGCFILIVDSKKSVAQLGQFPLPVEVIPFGLWATALAVEHTLEKLGLNGTIRLRQIPRSKGERHYEEEKESCEKDVEKALRTQAGHVILDLSLGKIEDPYRVSARLLEIPGVVEHGLFLDLAHLAYSAGPEGVQRIQREREW